MASILDHLVAQVVEEDPLFHGHAHSEHCPEGPHCYRCGRTVADLPEYEDIFDEGTYNATTNHFACDVCYIAIGTPTSPTGWVAP